MLIRERVQDWMDRHDLASSTARMYALTDVTTGSLFRTLVEHSFPFNRDALEIWRRWYRKQKEEAYSAAPDTCPEPGPPPPTPLHEVEGLGVRLFVILPDQQIPYHDRPLHDLVLRWLDTNKPYGKIYPGDVADWPGLSRHGWDPRMDPNPLKSTTNTIKQTRAYLAECLQAGGQGEDWMIPGNHEWRLIKYVAERAPHILDLEEDSGEATLSIERLLSLRKLGIRLAEGGYPQAKLWLSTELAVMHGWLARSRAAYTAAGTLDALGHSVIVGHTHRQGVTRKTFHPHDGPRTLLAAEAGTLTTIAGGLGYAAAADWQNGFLTVRIYPDGAFQLSEATYERGVLRWEDQYYTNGAHGVQVSA